MARLNKCATYLLAAVFCVLLVIGSAQSACALKITFEESPKPPKGVEIPPPDKLNPAPAVAPQGGTGGAGGAPGSSSSAGTGVGEPKRYKGVFTILKPVAPIFPLTSGTFSASVTNILNDRAWSVYASRYNGLANYYLEGGRDFSVIKDFKGKFQSNRQVKGNVTANSMNEFSGKIYGVDTKYINTKNRTYQPGALSVSDQRRLSMNYKLNDAMTLQLNRDETLAKGFSGGAAAKTNDRKMNMAFNWAVNNRMKFSLTRLDQANRNLTGSTTTKARQTEARLSYQATDKFMLEYLVQLLQNRSLQGGGPSTENRKNARLMTIAYSPFQNTNLTFKYNLLNDRNQNIETIANRDTTNREFQLSQAIFSWLKFSGSSNVSFSQATGKTAVKQSTLNVDHSKLIVFPGNTTVQIRKNLVRTGSLSDPTSNVTDNFSITTPLKYLDGKLTLNAKYDVNRQSGLAPAQETFSDTTTKTLDSNYKFTPTFSVGGGFNKNYLRTGTLPQINTLSSNLSVTDRMSLDIRNPLSEHLPFLPRFNYTAAILRNVSGNYLPTASRVETRILRNIGTFTIKLKNWDGSYVVEKSINKPENAAPDRATQQKLVFTCPDFLNFDLNLNYSITQQRTGSVGSGVFKVRRKRGEKSFIGLSYQFSKNQKYGIVNKDENILDRIFELTYETSL